MATPSAPRSGDLPGRSLSATRALGLLVLGALLLSLPGCSSGRERPGTPPKHLLLITAERVRRDHVTALGYERNTTGLLKLEQPYVLDIDYLGRGGVSFANAFVSSSDDRISVPSLLTGVAPTSAEALARDGPLPAQSSTLAEELAAKGFVTAAFVNRSSFTDAQCAEGGLGRGFKHAGFHATDEEMLAAAVTLLGAGVDGQQPTFIWLHFGGIRLPFEGEPLIDRFSDPEYAGPVAPELEFFGSLRAGKVELASQDRRRLRDLYDGQLAHVTQLLNSFFFLHRNTIADGALWPDTLVVFLGSSGCELAESEGRVANPDSLSGAGLHVPLVFWHPKSLTGERILDTVVEVTDVTATLRDWFDLEPTGRTSGQSLLKLTDSYAEFEFERRPAVATARAGQGVRGSTLRSERWRLVLEGDQARLYDLLVDPGERHDLAAHFPEVVEELRAQLSARFPDQDS